MGFLDRFPFSDRNAGLMGIEREFFLVDPLMNKPNPLAQSFLKKIQQTSASPEDWTYELSACQVEHRTKPCDMSGLNGIHELNNRLFQANREGVLAAQSIGYRLSDQNVAAKDMSLEVYPDVRYQKIAAQIPRDTLSAACRVIGTHIHVGAISLDDALRIYHRLVANLDQLIASGDRSNGECLRLYKQMATNWQPPIYRSATHFEDVAYQQGFADNPRNCWHLVRISVHGTVEIRVFGSSLAPGPVLCWVMKIREICR
ncbi:MAG: glutamate-cysteine ligase family protein [Patescibacteria group bacterium]